MCSIAIWGNISGRVEIDPLRKQLSQNLRQLVHMFYADFAYYFGCQFIFHLYEIIQIVSIGEIAHRVGFLHDSLRRWWRPGYKKELAF